MKSILLVSTILLASAAVSAAPKETTPTAGTPANAMVVNTPVAVATTTTSDMTMPTTLAFNFVGLSQGKTNVYFDVGGMSEKVAPALSFRSYSNKEPRKEQNNAKATVDRSLATLGASIAVFKRETKSIILNPYLFFGTEKDALNTSNTNGMGARLIGQANLNKALAIQAGLDGNAMEGDFKADVYVGVAFAL